MIANVDPVSALGDPTRRAIFERLAQAPSSVGAVARDLPVSRPAVSQHLKILKQAGLVGDRHEGNRRIYSLDPRGVDALHAYVEQFWNQSLAAFEDAAERRDEEVS